LAAKLVEVLVRLKHEALKQLKALRVGADLLANLFDDLLSEAELVGIVLLLDRMDLVLELPQSFLGTGPLLGACCVLGSGLRAREDDGVEGRPKLEVEDGLEAVGVFAFLGEGVTRGGQLHCCQEL